MNGPELAYQNKLNFEIQLNLKKSNFHLYIYKNIKVGTQSQHCCYDVTSQSNLIRANNTNNNNNHTDAGPGILSTPNDTPQENNYNNKNRFFQFIK